MKRIGFFLLLLAAIAAACAIYVVLKSEHALVAQPQGVIARSELDLILTNIHLMLLVVVPTFICLFLVVWRYRSKNAKAKYEPEKSHRAFKEVILWVIPASVVAVMATITWNKTHELDPYQPLSSDVKPLTIQVVALDWKWLFIYPEQGIATLNYVQFPERTPINFKLCADGSPMNSFWIPQLSGQIYAMTGMITPLHIMADGQGVYAGRAAEINGEGYADMTFVAESTSPSDFEDWIKKVKRSQLKLTYPVYDSLAKPAVNQERALYSYVEEDLFDKVVMKYMHHGAH